jgi:hypothetical protein
MLMLDTIDSRTSHSSTIEADRRNTDRFQLRLPACLIVRTPPSLSVFDAVLTDISVDGAQLHCDAEITEPSVWVRYTPLDGQEQIAEAELLWQNSGPTGEEKWVYGIRFTASLTTEILDGLLLESMAEQTGGTGSIFDDEPVAPREHIGDTAVLRGTPDSLLTEYLLNPAVSHPMLAETFQDAALFEAADRSNRRTSDRVERHVSGTVTVQVGLFGLSSQPVTIVTEDVSSSGVRLLAETPIARKSFLLTLKGIPELPGPIECEVRWHTERVEGVFCQQHRHAYGVRFAAPLSARALDALMVGKS